MFDPLADEEPQPYSNGFPKPPYTQKLRRGQSCALLLTTCEERELLPVCTLLFPSAFHLLLYNTEGQEGRRKITELLTQHVQQIRKWKSGGEEPSMD